MYVSHDIAVATVFERHTNDGRRVHIEQSVDMTELGTLVQNGFAFVVSVIWSAVDDQSFHGRG